MRDVGRSKQLATLVADAEDYGQPTSTWASIVNDAHATVVTLQGVAAVGRAAAGAPETATDREALELGIEAVRDPATPAEQQARDSIEDALLWLCSSDRGDSSLERILTWLGGMSGGSVHQLMKGVQGSLLAMQVDQAVADGVLQLGTGEVASIVPPGEALAAADELRTGNLVPGLVLEELLPKGVAAIRSVIQEGESGGESLAVMVEVGSEVMPVVTIAMAGAELASVWARRGDVDAAFDRLRGRATRAAALSALAYGVGLATGLEQSRVAITVCGQVGAMAVERVDRELAGSIDHVRGCRQTLEALPTDGARRPGQTASLHPASANT
jgi:hypothetical protein